MVAPASSDSSVSSDYSDSSTSSIPCSVSSSSAIRLPTVAGQFYPAEPLQLSNTVQQFINAALAAKTAPASSPSSVPKVLIVPYAGYRYSGAVAAAAYARLAAARHTIRRVILLGPSHRVAVDGLALPSAAFFETPLGPIEIDQQAVAAALQLPHVHQSDEAHTREYSLEVHLPFLQNMLEDFKLVPFSVGSADPQTVANLLDALWGGPETLIVISSDMSHFHPYDRARLTDSQTADEILTLSSTLTGEKACGAVSLNGLLLSAQRRNMAIRLLDMRNSGDVTGDHSSVVGYAAFALENTDSFSEVDSGYALLYMARYVIGRIYAIEKPRPLWHPLMQKTGASFITLMLSDKLRGCIGSLQAHRALGIDIRENALAAAFRDPRFPPLNRTEFDRMHIEISVLTPPQPLQFQNEADLLEQLRPGVDGLILQHQQQRSTFLPQVWEQIPDPRAFFNELKRKAELPTDFWSPALQVSRYQVTKWREA